MYNSNNNTLTMEKRGVKIKDTAAEEITQTEDRICLFSLIQIIYDKYKLRCANKINRETTKDYYQLIFSGICTPVTHEVLKDLVQAQPKKVRNITVVYPSVAFSDQGLTLEVEVFMERVFKTPSAIDVPQFFLTIRYKDDILRSIENNGIKLSDNIKGKLKTISEFVYNKQEFMPYISTEFKQDDGVFVLKFNNIDTIKYDFLETLYSNVKYKELKFYSKGLDKRIFKVTIKDEPNGYEKLMPSRAIPNMKNGSREKRKDGTIYDKTNKIKTE